jgi:NADPH-dependent 7-cyano-7-deazaguanine reductase QueF-like protein
MKLTAASCVVIGGMMLQIEGEMLVFSNSWKLYF